MRNSVGRAVNRLAGTLAMSGQKSETNPERTYNRDEILRMLGGGAVACLLPACTVSSQSEQLPPIITGPSPSTTQGNPEVIDGKPIEGEPDTSDAATTTSTEATTTTTEPVTPETTEPAPPTTEAIRPERAFKHSEPIPADLTLTISRTGRIVDSPLHAFIDPKSDPYDNPILNDGGMVVTGDSYPLNIFGLDERYVDENGKLRPMAVGYHRKTDPAGGYDIAEIEIANSPGRRGDILEFNGQRYVAVDMYLVADDDIELQNELLGSFYEKPTIFFFACTEINDDSQKTADAQAAVDAALRGTYDVKDPYLTDEVNNPNARILVKFELLDP